MDIDSAIRLYEFNLSHKIDGIFVMGTMGECPLLTPEERDELAKIASESLKGKTKTLIGLTVSGLPNILRNMERWNNLPNTHWTIALPTGWAGPTNTVDYMHRIGNASDKPIYFYITPLSANLTPQQLKEILEHPKIIGIKNSTGSIRLRKELLLLKKTLNFELLEGEEWAIDEALFSNCDGAIGGFGSVGGKIMKKIAEHSVGKEYDEAIKLQNILIDMYHRVYGTDLSSWCIGQKYALEYLGVLKSCATRIARYLRLAIPIAGSGGGSGIGAVGTSGYVCEETTRCGGYFC